MYLHIEATDYGLNSHAHEPLPDELILIADGTLDIVRFSGGFFEKALVEKTEVLDDEDDDDSETHTEYKLSWERL